MFPQLDIQLSVFHLSHQNPLPTKINPCAKYDDISRARKPWTQATYIPHILATEEIDQKSIS